MVDGMVGQMEAGRQKVAAWEAWMLAEKRAGVLAEERVEKEKIDKFLAEQDINGPDLTLGKKRARTEPSTATASYWIPSESQKSQHKPIPAKPDTRIYCPHGPAKHRVTLKGLIPVHFTVISSPDEAGCGACRRALNNGVDMSALIPCGHVFCTACLLNDDAEKKDVKRCPMCEGAVEKRAGLAREGTGFAAAGGSVLLSKPGLAFQC